MTKKTIVILNSVSDFERFESLNQLDYKNILFFPTDLKISFFLKKTFLTYKVLEDFITKEEMLLINDTAYKIAEQWHNDIFKFKYISLAKVMELVFKGFLSRIIKNAQVINNVLAKENPSRIISFNNNNNIFISEFNDVLKFICKNKNIKLEIFSGESIKDISKPINTPKTKLRKHFKFIRQIFTITFLNLIFNFSLLIPPIKNKNKKKILLYQYRLYNFHPSITKNLLKNPRLNLFYFDFSINIRKLRNYFFNQFSMKKKKNQYFFFF